MEKLGLASKRSGAVVGGSTVPIKPTMLHKLYHLLIEPRQQDDDLRNRELVLNVLFIGTLGILASAVLLIIDSYIDGSTYVLLRIISLSAVWALTLAMYLLSRSGHYRLAAWFLVGLYSLLAIAVAYTWGVTFPPAVLLFGLVIMISGTVLGSPMPLYVAGGMIVIAFGLQLIQHGGSVTPDTSWINDPLGAGTVYGLCLMFGVIGLISWLFNEQTERSLHRAHRAEAGLLRQKLLLESTVEKRTRQLQAAQLEKIQQLYRFAELGQLSTALLHELANHMAVLTLDIEGLEAKNSSQVLQRAKRSIRYIDDMVIRVRDQLHGRTNVRHFSVANELDDIVTILRHRAVAVGVALHWEALSDRKGLRSKGEPIRLRQLMANLISNAIDSYDAKTEKAIRREVFITAEATDKNITISIADWGKGISPGDKDKIFEPFF